MWTLKSSIQITTITHRITIWHRSRMALRTWRSPSNCNRISRERIKTSYIRSSTKILLSRWCGVGTLLSTNNRILGTPTSSCHGLNQTESDPTRNSKHRRSACIRDCRPASRTLVWSRCRPSCPRTFNSIVRAESINRSIVVIRSNGCTSILSMRGSMTIRTWYRQLNHQRGSWIKDRAAKVLVMWLGPLHSPTDYQASRGKTRFSEVSCAMTRCSGSSKATARWQTTWTTD